MDTVVMLVLDMPLMSQEFLAHKLSPRQSDDEG